MKKAIAPVLILLAAVLIPAAVEAQPAPAAVERNGRAFLFVLEFALAAPLTSGQEETVLSELLRGWQGQSDEERAKFDAYPKLVEAIIHASEPKALEDLRQALESAVREWLGASDRTDPAVAVIAGALKEKGRVLVPGNPPLTAMAAASYSELYAYSEVLAKSPAAAPSQVPSGAAARVKARLLAAWNGFTPEERSQVASTPGLWASLRSVLRYGTPEEQSRVRVQLAAVAAPRQAGEEQSSGKTDVVGRMIKHHVMMNIQQQTFNHYLYCRGFKSSIY